MDPMGLHSFKGLKKLCEELQGPAEYEAPEDTKHPKLICNRYMGVSKNRGTPNDPF